MQNQTLKVPPGCVEAGRCTAIHPPGYHAPQHGSGRNQSGDCRRADGSLHHRGDGSLRGIDVIPASDLATALNAQGLKPMDINPRTAADLAAAKFGATAIMIGQVSRYRERQGEKFGSTGAASVAFNATIYTTDPVQRVWSSKFDGNPARALGAHRQRPALPGWRHAMAHRRRTCAVGGELRGRHTAPRALSRGTWS